MSMCSHLLCCWKRVFAMTSAFSWQNSVSLCPASFCIPRPNLPVAPDITSLPTFAFQSLQTKLVEVMEFQLSYLKSWKMMLWKCCTQYAQQIWKTQQWPQDWKRSVFIPIPKKGNAKECSNYHTFALISHASKVTLKILQARLQQYKNCELPDVQAGL